MSRSIVKDLFKSDAPCNVWITSVSYGVDLKALRHAPKLNHFLLPAETACLVLSQLPFVSGSEPSKCGEIHPSSRMITFDEWTVYTNRL